jgi:hypothetical protein
MNPSDAHSSLAALRQLKEMLDVGTITPTEFETLKRQIVFGQEPALPVESAPTEAFASPEAAPIPDPLASPEAPVPYQPITANAPEDSLSASPKGESEWLASVAPSLRPTEEYEALPPEEEHRNPLNLVFAIGGLVVFLGVVAFLLMGRPTTPDEHLTSGTQTAADSVAIVPEVGPQAEQLTLPPATAPETIRVAPVTQPVPAQAASQFRTDSVTAPLAAPRATKAPATVPAAGSTVVTDSSSTTQAP